MTLRLAALALGTVTGFVFAWTRMTDPDTFRVLAVAVAAGVLCGVALQPRLARAAEHARRRPDAAIPGVQGAEVL